MSTTHPETVCTLAAARDWIALAADQVRPFGPGASAQHDAILARIDRALAAEAQALTGSETEWNQKDQRHPSPCGPKVYL